MDNNCKTEKRSCTDNCRATRKEVGKIMAVLGLIAVSMAWYIISNGILEKVFT